MAIICGIDYGDLEPSLFSENSCLILSDLFFFIITYLLQQIYKNI